MAYLDVELRSAPDRALASLALRSTTAGVRLTGGHHEPGDVLEGIRGHGGRDLRAAFGASHIWSLGGGTCGLPESKLGELAPSAGFDSVQKLPLDNPFNNLYEVKP